MSKDYKKLFEKNSKKKLFGTLKDKVEELTKSTVSNKSRDFAFRVQVEMENLKMNQIELAERIGVTKQCVNRWLKGRENLKLETICNIENALGVEIMPVLQYDEIVVRDIRNIGVAHLNIKNNFEIKSFCISTQEELDDTLNLNYFLNDSFNISLKSETSLKMFKGGYVSNDEIVSETA